METNAPMMTRVQLQEVLSTQLECDTAASHSVLSLKVFQVLQSKLKKKLAVVPERVVIRLADGTQSQKSCMSATISVRRNLHSGRMSTPVTLSFFVIDGPNSLLGRLALERLWPEQYKALRDITASMVSAQE